MKQFSFKKSTIASKKDRKGIIKNEGKASNKHEFKSVLRDLTTTKSILSKMVAMFLLLIIVPVSTIGFIAARTSSGSLTNSAEDSLVAATKLTSSYFDIFMDKAEGISMQIISNKSIQDYSLIDQQDITDYDNLQIQKNAVLAMTSINSSISDMNVKLLYNNGNVLDEYLSQIQDMTKAKNSGWFKRVQEAQGKPVLGDPREGLEELKANDYALSLLRSYRNVSLGHDLGVVIVDIKHSSVSKILSGIDLGLKDSTYLITNEGMVLSKDELENENELMKRQFIKDTLERSVKKESDLFYTNDNGTRYLVSFNKSANTGLTAVTIVPNTVITAGASQIVSTTIVTGVIFVLLAAIFGFIFSLRMSQSMKSLMGVMSKAEAGDLTASLTMKRKDEIGKLVASFNKMMSNIRELVVQSKRAADEVAVSSEKMTSISSESTRISTEIAHAIVEVASGSSNQATEVETSVKNVSQLADRITLAVEKTKIMEADAEAMKEISNYGIATIGNLNRKTAETNKIASDVVREIAQLNQYVKNINVITSVLRSIADQTNLLALNAAIEAARAGDAGKGFAVVADEIRKLAEQSNNHTRDIQKHIENVFKQSQSSTDLVARAENSFKEQSVIVTETAEAFSKINSTTLLLTENIDKLGSMIESMDSYKEMVMSSMENISAVSEQVSASTQEVSASTEEQLASIEQLDEMSKNLHELAEDLITRMQKFVI